jgi:hypothetical protein
MLGLTGGSRRGRQRTKCEEPWHHKCRAKQNLIYKAVENRKRKRLRDSKTLYLLLRKSNGITSGRLRPERTTTKSSAALYINLCSYPLVHRKSNEEFKC